MTPEALDRALADTPEAVGAHVVSPTYFGAVADVRGLVEVAHSHGVPLVVDEAWGAHLPFHPDLPAHALAAGRGPRRLEHPQDRRQPHAVGDGPPGPRRPDRGARSSTAASRSPSRRARTRCCARRWTPRGGCAATRGRELARRDDRGAGADARGDPRDPGTRRARRAAWRARRACTTTTRCGSRSTSAAPARPATSWRGRLREATTSSSSSAARTSSWRCSGWARTSARQAERLRRRRCDVAVDAAIDANGDAEHEPFAPPPPWGELAMTPREAFLGPQEVVPVARRRGPGRRGVAGGLPARHPERAARRAADAPRRSTTSSRRWSMAACCAARATASCGRCAWPSSPRTGQSSAASGGPVNSTPYSAKRAVIASTASGERRSVRGGRQLLGRGRLAQRAERLLESAGREHLKQRGGLRDDSEPVLHSARHEHGVARARIDALVPALERDLAVEHVEDLVLTCVDV